jgi:AcrR family transcriptional regulator
MAKGKSKKFDKEQVVEKTMQLAAKDWGKLSLEQIAKACGCSVIDLKKHFKTKEDILSAFSDIVTQRAAKQAGKEAQQGPLHDRLFAVLMARFDIMQKYRPGLVQILKHKNTLWSLLPVIGKNMQEALRLVLDRKSQKLAGVGSVPLTLLYVDMLRVWEADKSDDLAKTMAALDKRLRLLSRLKDLVRQFGAALEGA